MRLKLKSLEERTVVITGGSSGLGLATATRAAERGVSVVIMSRDEMAELYGDQRHSMRKVSIFTTFSTYPKTTIAAAAGAGMAGAAFASWLLKPSRQKEQEPAPRDDEASLGEQPRADDLVLASAAGRRMDFAD